MSFHLLPAFHIQVGDWSKFTSLSGGLWGCCVNTHGSTLHEDNHQMCWIDEFSSCVKFLTSLSKQLPFQKRNVTYAFFPFARLWSFIYPLPKVTLHQLCFTWPCGCWKEIKSPKNLKHRCQADKHSENRQDTKLQYCNILCASDTFKIYFDML